MQTENLVQVSSLLQSISRGDLTVRMQGDFHGVFARMRDDCNATVDQLTQIVGRIRPARPASTWRQARSPRATPTCRGAPSSRRRTWKRLRRRWRN